MAEPKRISVVAEGVLWAKGVSPMTPGEMLPQAADRLKRLRASGPCRITILSPATRNRPMRHALLLQLYKLQEQGESLFDELWCDDGIPETDQWITR